MTGSPDIRPPRRAEKGNGQWLVDGTEPLNANETWKQDGEILAVRDRIEQRYAAAGFAAIDPEDLRGRFRWWGLYTQRRPGIDGGRTASLAPEELEDEFFMLRIRLDGGQLTTRQLRTIGDVSTRYARGTADLTDRQNIQLHWVRIEDVPEIWRRLEEVGLGTTESCGDVARVILASPVAGVAADELIDPTPQLHEITARFLGDPSIENLPRKFKSAITGHPSQDVVHEINDIAFVAVRHPELGIGYDLWVGGALSTAPRLAERLGAFVPPERVAETWYGVIRLYRDYGYRRLRHKARLKFLLAEWGTERFREVLEREYLDAPLPDGPAPQAAAERGDHVGVHRQRDGRFYVGAAPVVGRVSGPTLTALADLAEAHGSQRVRTTPHQKLIVLDVPEDRVEAFARGLEELGLTPRPSVFRRATIACTGIEYCKLAIVETKQTATDAVRQLEERLGPIAADLPHPLTLHVNGCPNSCARIQIADIGLRGQLVPDGDGGQTPGFQVHLGGTLASGDAEAGLGRTVRGLKVDAGEVADYVERVVTAFLRDRAADETFARWAHRADEALLR